MAGGKKIPQEEREEALSDGCAVKQPRPALAGPGAARGCYNDAPSDSRTRWPGRLESIRFVSGGGPIRRAQRNNNDPEVVRKRIAMCTETFGENGKRINDKLNLGGRRP